MKRAKILTGAMAMLFLFIALTGVAALITAPDVYQEGGFTGQTNGEAGESALININTDQALGGVVRVWQVYPVQTAALSVITAVAWAGFLLSAWVIVKGVENEQAEQIIS